MAAHQQNVPHTSGAPAVHGLQLSSSARDATSREFTSTCDDYLSNQSPARDHAARPRLVETPVSTTHRRRESFGEALIVVADDNISDGLAPVEPVLRSHTNRLHDTDTSDHDVSGYELQSRGRRWSHELVQRGFSDYEDARTARRISRRSSSPPELVGGVGADYCISPSTLIHPGQDYDPRSPQFSVKPGTRQFWDLE